MVSALQVEEEESIFNVINLSNGPQVRSGVHELMVVSALQMEEQFNFSIFKRLQLFIHATPRKC